MITQERADYIREFITAALRRDGRLAARRAARMVLINNSVVEITDLAPQMPEEIRRFILAEAERPRLT